MRKRLNNKGFTLVELLAVVVILAIVMGISANAVLTSINNSRKSSLYSAVQNAANTINTWATEDAMTVNNNEKMLGDAFVKAVSSTNAGSWVCLNNGSVSKIVNRAADGQPNTSLLTVLGVSSNDIKTDGTAPVATGYTTVIGESPTACSAIRYNKSTGGYELLFIANTGNGGKYYVPTDKNHYAFSRASGPYTLITD